MGWKSILLRLRRDKRRRRPRQSLLLSGPPSRDPRLPDTSVDPNANFLGDQMGNGGLG